jgi:hypothetical protein
MMRSNKLWFVSTVVFLLTACGQDVRLVYDRQLYHTQEFKENHYQNRLLTTTLGPATYSSQGATILTFANDNIRRAIPTSIEDPFGDQFALQQKLSRQMPAVAYGIESKLFDGILYCTDAQRLSKSRLQLLPEGMGYVFPESLKQSASQTLGLFMKAGADTNQQGQHIRSLNVTLTLFKKITSGWNRVVLQLAITDFVQSAFPGYYEVTLPNQALIGTEAFGFEYEIIDPLPAVGAETLTGVFLYEMLFPGSVWGR